MRSARGNQAVSEEIASGCRPVSASSRAIIWLLLSFFLFIACRTMANLPPALAAAKAQPVKGQSYTVRLPNGYALEMLWCPAGSFQMGSPESERGRLAEENLHKVTLTSGFWLGKYEVTQRQFYAVMGRNPSDFTGDANRPVETVSWDNAMAFCHKLNNLRSAELPAGYRFTLPTEAQWEYACRAGTSSALNNGQELTSVDGNCANLNRLGWYAKNSGGSTHPVGKRQPNAWGFYDMHGNVWEWCSDWYGGYRATATDPKGVASGEDRVRRGGSWCLNARCCRSAYRHCSMVDQRDIYVGLRLALSAVQ